MTKRDLLLAIVDNPGWAPPDDAPPAIGVYLAALIREGWVLPRLDGYEGSPQALDEYPAFLSQADVADLDAASATEDDEPPEPRDVSLKRVECLIMAALCELPLMTVLRMTTATPQGLPSDKALWTVARQAARRMM